MKTSSRSRSLPVVLLGFSAGLSPLCAVPTRILPEALAVPGFSLSTDASLAGKSDLKAGGDVAISAFHFGIAQEIPAGDKAGFSVGLTYGHIGIDQGGANARTPLPDELRTLSLDLSYEHKFSDQWSVLAGLSPGFSSAGSGFDSDSFGCGGVALGTWAYSADLSFSLGVGFYALGSETGVSPAFGATWKINPRWSLAAGYPSTALVYSPAEKWTFALVIEGAGGAYHVEADPAPGAAGRPSLEDSTLSYDDLRAGLSARHQFTEDLGVGVTVGYLIKGTFDYDSPNYKVKTDGGAVYGSVSLAFTF